MKPRDPSPARRELFPRIPLSALLLAGVLASAAAGCRARNGERPAAASAGSRSNFLLITVDTLRPDALGWVSGKNETPAIDRLAREGFSFPAAVSPVPLTLPSHASIMTGRLPRRLGLRDNGQLLGDGPPTLAAHLRARGYGTAAFVSGYPVASPFGLDRGFQLYDDHLPAGGGAADLERPAAATTAAARAWLRSARPPWFAWVHYYDPHYPYEPPPGFGRPGWRGSYDGEVASVDRAIGELLAGLDPAGAQDTLIVFAADHGESLGEHGEGTHGFFLYESTVAVPLIVHFPGRVRPGRSHSAARLVDVAPTALELLREPALEGTDGSSLVTLLEGRGQEVPPAYIETYQPWISYGWSPLKAVRQGAWKLIVAPRPELYDLETDPGEERNLVDSNPDRARELENLRRRTESIPRPQSAPVSSDPEAAARLRSLGYLGGGSSGGEPPAHGLRDPKDGGDLRDLLTEGDLRLRRGEFRASLPKFDQVLDRDPDNRFALLRSGVALLRLGDSRSSIARLRRAVRLDPDQPEARLVLTEALLKSGEHGAAAEQATEAARLQPRRAEAWSSLGTALGLSGRVKEAAGAFSRAAELEPRDPRFLAKLAFAEHAAGRVEGAASHLIRLAEMTGSRFEYSGALGILLVRLGRRQEARSWLERSRPAEGDFADARFELALLELESGDRADARRSLRQALAAAPRLRGRVESDPRLAPLLP